MSYEPIKMVRVIKNGTTFHNFYVLGVLVKPVQNGDYTKLYYSASQYMKDHSIPLETFESKGSTKKNSKKADSKVGTNNAKNKK